jgi:UDP-N-acetylmuramoyl-tripeptide--D-alanyl-D-alanine ligase
MSAALWTVKAMADAMRAHARGPLPPTVAGLSIDSRTLQPGEAFFAITGDNSDGHDYVASAIAAKAGLAVVSQAKCESFAKEAPLLVVDDVLEGLRDLARVARKRTDAKVVGVTGSVGKTGTKEALKLVFARQGLTHASAESYNNHWGVPLSLARCPADARYAIFEMGMNHAGEIGPLAQLVRPQIAIITGIAPVHLEYFKSLDGIADAKAEIFEGIEPAGAAILNRDSEHFERLAKKAKGAKIAKVVSFGEHEKADARLIQCALQPGSSTVHANILGADVKYKIGAPGRHLVHNSLAVLAAAVLAGADLAISALALADLTPPSGRGTHIPLVLPGGAALLIDESYNANPVSMRAALALLGQAQIGPRGRRVAVLGDMLELGNQADALHRELTGPIVENTIDLVFCCGPAMHALWQALPSGRRGGYAEDSKGLESRVIDAVQAGDAIMVKGSNGSKMAPIVKALERAYARAPQGAQAQG